jgi:hypothetical protein
MPGASRTRKLAISAGLDGFLFGFAGIGATWVAWLVLREGFREGWQMTLLLVFYVMAAYLVLPRLHRMLTSLYLPGYFIGRTRTSDGLLGDPVNLAALGREAQIHVVMRAAGWTLADPVTLRSSIRIVTATLSRRGYPEAPVSPLHLFDRQQDFAYQQEVPGRASARHHVRFWRCPDDWMLPGGYAVDWVAAGTYDRTVGLSLLTFQVTHRIAEDIDAERDHITSTMLEAHPEVEVRVIRNFSTGYHSRNGGGDRIETDGDLPVIDVRAVPADADEAVPAPRTDSRARRPVATVFGAGTAALRGAYLLSLGLVVLLSDRNHEFVAWELASAAAAAYVAVGVAVADLALAVLTFLGSTWARLLLMLGCAIPIVVAFIDDLRVTGPPTLSTNLPPVALGILVLLALTSRKARDFASQRRIRATDRAQAAGRPGASAGAVA